MASVNEVKDFAQKLLVCALTIQTSKKDHLYGKGLTSDDLEEWQVGLSEGDLMEQCLKQFGNDSSTLDLIVRAGIANVNKKGLTTNAIPTGCLTFPALLNGEISHWVLRATSGRHPSKTHPDKCSAIMYNQQATEGKTFWVVLDPWDVILLKQKGKPAIATDGWPRKEQAEWLKNLAEFSSAFPDELQMNKVLHICFHAGANHKGLRQAEWLSHELCQYHEVHLYKLPEANSIAQLYAAGGKVEGIERTQITERAPKVYEKADCYHYRQSPEKTEIISNFVIRPDFVIVDDEGLKTYDVMIRMKGKEAGPYKIESRDWKAVSSFTEWCGKCDGRYTFMGNMTQLLQCKDFWFKKSSRTIRKIAGLGNVLPRLWLWDDGCIYDGVRIDADENRICWLPPDNTVGAEGVQTVQNSDQNKWLQIPTDHYDMDTIIRKLGEFYPIRRMLWLLIGFAVATIHFKKLTQWLGCFPVMFCYGPHQSGKTRYSKIIASLCGNGPLEVPSSLSTPKSMCRYISHHHAMPIVYNEFEGMSKEALINAFFDLDPPMRAEFSNDSRTSGSSINASCCLTSVNQISRADRVSRLVYMNFYEFANDLSKRNRENPDRAGDFGDYYEEAVIQNRNGGFLFDLLESDCADRIIPVIKKARRVFATELPDMEARQNLVYSTVVGSFLAAYDSLDLGDIFRKYEIEVPTKELIRKEFASMVNVGTQHMKQSGEMALFFEILYSLRDERETTEHMWVEDQHLYFSLKKCFGPVKQAAQRRGIKTLEAVKSDRWIAERIKYDLPHTNGTHYHKMTTNRVYSYKVALHDLTFTYGLDTADEEEPKNAVDALT